MYKRSFIKTCLTFLFVTLFISGCKEQTLPGKSVSQLAHADLGAYAAAISADGRYSLVSSTNQGVLLWDNQSNTVLFQWHQDKNEQNLVHSLAISFDSQVAVTATDTDFALWDIKTGQNRGFYRISKSTIRDIAISNEGRFVLYGRADNVVVLVDLAEGRRLEFLGHTEKINSIALSPNGHFALTGGNDYTAYFWDTRTGQVIHRFNHPSRVTKVALDNEGRYAFTADSMKKASIWRLTSGELVSQLQYIARQKIFSAVTFNKQGTLLATGTPNRQLTLWDLNTGEKQGLWQVEPREGSRPKSAVVFAAAFVDNDAALLTESSNGMLERFERNN
ncbi:WD40 repeat domain-containing protein [Pseudoalteromonas xiamenensis]|uniref:PQQ-binding-like beta-propeller repeat protein n=1 Tax=Pseudoalteromonas xiamenensis TaxID=882626 RepID=A0A975DEL8_9GAMM|nr:PQQ-binding-like beta-propeller repeat protein [Pseudoalteromonas xiamenensis]QTH70411.1 PQQ-binding-like beta-propeller repeat protein [Pseudoalteromonas xiamenensis]